MKLCDACGINPLKKNAKKYCSISCANRVISATRTKKTTVEDRLSAEDWARYIRARRYKLSLLELDVYLASNGGKCWLCNDRKATCIDHDHETKKVRGMLCNRCNTGLGFLGDTVESLEQAIQYLKASVDNP